MSQALDLTDKNFNEEILKSSLPALVDFWAPWCGPCKMMGPVLDELARELAGKVKIAKLNVDEAANQALAAEYDIQGIPNLKLFKNGQVVKEFTGFQPGEVLKKEIEDALK
jgi:thioredoxin 1